MRISALIGSKSIATGLLNDDFWIKFFSLSSICYFTSFSSCFVKSEPACLIRAEIRLGSKN